MIRVNKYFEQLQANYLFANINKKVAEYQQNNPGQQVLSLGIGDVSQPLPDVCILAMHKAIDEQANSNTFRGYGPEQGYEFLRDAIAKNDFQLRGADIQADEIFISDGAKSDTANIQDIFAFDTKIAIPDPVYPVYLDTSVISGRAGNLVGNQYENLVYLSCTKDNNYLPALPDEPADLIYLCFPNNPTGVVANRAQLKIWVDYARENQALILFDAAYEAFIRDADIPHSIYEIPGAKEVAIEFRSFSKTAGFTGMRCAYTVVPKECVAYTEQQTKKSLHQLWQRRQSTKFNGVAYPIQRAAQAIYTADGQAQVRGLTDYYMQNAAFMRQALESMGFTCFGGVNSPYIWLQVATGSWEFFDHLLTKAGVVCTPGAGFGSCGENHVRLSAFNSLANIKQAMQQIKQMGKAYEF